MSWESHSSAVMRVIAVSMPKTCHKPCRLDRRQSLRHREANTVTQPLRFPATASSPAEEGYQPVKRPACQYSTCSSDKLPRTGTKSERPSWRGVTEVSGCTTSAARSAAPSFVLQDRHRGSDIAPPFGLTLVVTPPHRRYSSNQASPLSGRVRGDRVKAFLRQIGSL